MKCFFCGFTLTAARSWNPVITKSLAARASFLVALVTASFQDKTQLIKFK